MDPVTLLVGVFLGAGLVGGGWLAVTVRRYRSTRRLREAVRKRLPVGEDAPVSLFELFWDLGASEYALEMLAEAGLLLESPDRLPWLYQRLPERVGELGSYDAYVATHLEAIEHFYDQHRNRQRPLELESPERRLMRLPAYAGPMREETDELDLDRIGPDPINMVSDLLRGDARGLVELITGGSTRAARKQLDSALAGLYRVYDQQRTEADGRASPLERSAAEWDAEAMRLVRMAAERDWADEPWARCADVLVDEARELAASLAERSRTNVRGVLDRIDDLARRRDHAAAGHLVYINRARLLPAGIAAVDRQLAEVEDAARLLHAELGSA